MYIKVIGVTADNKQYTAIVEGDSAEAVRDELIYCMGINASNERTFINELLDIGFMVITKIPGADLDGFPVVTIPINLNDNDMF